MRCLYCGKELPLFKRLRGGEFCSDAHRQQYQEEYTQLALNRLLQANSAGEPEPAKSKGANAPAKESKPLPASVKPVMEMESPALKRRERLAREEPPAPAPTLTPVPSAPVAKAAPLVDAPPTPARVAAPIEMHPRTAVMEHEPPPSPVISAPEPVHEEPPPAEVAGFLIEVPVAVMAELPAISKKEPELESPSAPVLPRMIEFRSGPQDLQLLHAERIVPIRMARAAESFPAPRDRGIEVREFVRPLPVVEIRLAPAGEIGLSYAQEPLELKFEYQSPSGSARPWQQMDCEFPLTSAVLGDLARLELETSGWSEPAIAESQGEEPLPREAPKPLASSFPPAPAAQTVRFDPVRLEPGPVERILPEPMHFEPVHIEPVFMERIAVPVVAKAPAVTAPAPPPAPAPEVAPVPEPAFEPAPPAMAEVATPEPIPDAVTKPLPVTLHGLAPLRGKSVQVFASGLARAAEVLTPVQNTLPLRPVMVLAPAPPLEAPAKTTVAVPVRAVGDKPEQRPAGKGRKPEVRVLSLHLREDKKGEIKPETKPEAKPEAKKDAPPPQLKIEPRAEPKPELQKAPAPAPEKIDLPTPPPEPVPVSAEAPAEVPQPVAKETRPSPFDEEPRPKPVERPKQPERELPKPLNAPATPPEFDSLGLPKLAVEADGNFWTKLPAFARIGVAAGFLALIAGGIFLTSKGTGAPHGGVASSPSFPEVGPPITDAGWAADWFTDGAASKQARHVDVLSGTLTQRDYRMEFEAQIEHQAIGWVFRANNKSFYVEKIAIAGPGFEPPIELVRFPVIDGKEESRSRIPLPFKVHLDTMYKIRTDVVGGHFTTWVQDQKVDEWDDSRIDAGGVGLYYDSGDVPKLKGSINVMPLKSR